MRLTQKLLTALMILSILCVSTPMQKSSGQQTSTVTSTQTMTTSIVTRYTETSNVSAAGFPPEGTLTFQPSQPSECGFAFVGPTNVAANNVLSLHVSASDGIDFGIISNSTLAFIMGFFGAFPLASPMGQQALLLAATSDQTVAQQASSAQSLWKQEYAESNMMVPDFNSFLLGALVGEVAAGNANGNVAAGAVQDEAAWGLSTMTKGTFASSGSGDVMSWTAIQSALVSSHYFGTDLKVQWLLANVGVYYLTFMSCHPSQVSGSWEGSFGLPFTVTSTVAATSTLTTTQLVPIYTEDIALLVLVIVIALSIGLALRAHGKRKIPNSSPNPNPTTTGSITLVLGDTREDNMILCS